ncbi:MAG: F0F1 ATP synthase subunit A, partial [Alphaproteobacteria bacterium]
MAEQSHGPMTQFEIKEIIPVELGSFDLSFTNSALFSAIAASVACLLLIGGIGRRAMVPGRVQMIVELLYGFVANMVRETIGSEGRRYFPFVFTLFVFILLANLLGMVPYSFTVTSHIAVTGAFALFVFLLMTVIGFGRHGLRFFGFFVPSGVPAPLLLLVVPIEVLSYFMRPISHSVRLFANMLAGHTMLKVFAGFIIGALSLGAAGAAPIGLFTIAGIVALTGLEIL